MRTDIGVPNGLAFSPDGRTMYWADTHRDTVWAYDYDVDTGEATNERVFLDFATLPGRPDGACVDDEGATGSPASTDRRCFASCRTAWSTGGSLSRR